jgi:hypothetical protein
MLVPIVGGILLLLTAVVLIIILVIRNLVPRDEANPGMAVSVIKVTPTPFTSPLPVPGCQPPIIGSDDVQVTVSLPLSLSLGDTSFPVAATAPEPEGWTYPADSAGSAAWICGTVVNYVVGLEATPQNKLLVTTLRPGDEIVLQLSDGKVLFFRFVERREVSANDPSVFEQSRPRLTLVLDNGDEAWKIATADYATETEPVLPSDDPLAQPDQPVRLGDIEVTVVRGYSAGSGLGLTPGTMYYLVEFSIKNMGTAGLDANGFNMQLQDSVGNGYLPSPAASAAGEHGPVSGQIAPGATVQGTAGYLVPEALPGPALIWTIRPWPESELRASVSIPFEGGTTTEEPITVGRATVTITDAFLDDDILVIEGEVRNVGTGPLTIELGDITLSSSAGMSDLFVAAPPLPWTVGPGEGQIIELQYDTPDAPTVLLTLVGYSFEIGNLD